MTRTKLGLLGLCAVVLGLMAISANAAQAAKWLILDKGEPPVALDAAKLPAILTGEFEEGTDGILLTKILEILTHILCKSFALSGVSLEGEGKLTTGGKVKFTGCSVTLNKEPNSECNPHSNGSPVGTIETLKAKGQLKLIGTAGLTKIEPETGTTFVTVEMGAGCPIGNKVPIAGVLTIEDCEGLLEKHLVRHLIQENAANTTLTALGNKATIDGSAWVFLAAPHTGFLWGGDKE